MKLKKNLYLMKDLEQFLISTKFLNDFLMIDLTGIIVKSIKQKEEN